MKAIILTLLILLTLAGSRIARANQNNTKPISEDGLIKLLANKLSAIDLVRAIEIRGVGFQLTSLFEQELTRAGEHLGKKGLNDLLIAIRANFRPPAVRPYRLSYRLLRGQAVELLLEGKIGRWDTALDGRYFIVPNEVFTTLSDLVTRFSEEFYGDKFFRADGTRRTARGLASQYRSEHKRLFVGSSGTVAWDYDELDAVQIGELVATSSDISPLVDSLKDPSERWRLNAFEKKPFFWQDKKSYYDVLSFRRFSKEGDLDFFEATPLQEFYSYITKEYLPPNFGLVDLSFEVPPGDCGHHARQPEGFEWTVTFFGPQLSLNVAIIENVSNEPIAVGRFILKENPSNRLQSRQAIQTAFAARPAKKQDLFRLGILKPGESLVVPIELSLKTDKRDLDLYLSFSRKQIPPSYYSDLLTQARATGGLSIPGNKVGMPLTISTEALERMMKSEKIDFLSNNEYVYGPSVSIESLEINKFGYLVRQFDPSKLLITSGSDSQDVGSCPYVYSYSARRGAWQSEGVILYGINSKLKESTDEIELNQFDGRVLIQEKDPEDSFIDSVYIRALGNNGKETILYPENVKLLAADGDYLALRRGDQLVVQFTVPKGFVARKYVLVASGYYIPYNNAADSAGRKARPINKLAFPKKSK